MSLYGGKLGGVETSLTPDGVLSVVHPYTACARIKKPTAEQAVELLALVDQAEKIDDGHTVGFEANGLTAQAVQAIVWAKVDGDTWRVSHDQKVVLLTFGDEYAVFAAGWKGFDQLKAEVKRYFKKCIDGRGGGRSGSGRKPSPVKPIKTTVLLPPDLFAYAKEKGNVSAYIARLISNDKS